MRLRYDRRMKLDYFQGGGISVYRIQKTWRLLTKYEAQIHEVENKTKDSQPRKGGPPNYLFMTLCLCQLSEAGGGDHVWGQCNHRGHTEWQCPHSIMMVKSTQSLYLPSQAKLWCTLQLRGQTHSPYFSSTPLCTLFSLTVQQLQQKCAQH